MDLIEPVPTDIDTHMRQSFYAAALAPDREGWRYRPAWRSYSLSFRVPPMAGFEIEEANLIRDAADRLYSHPRWESVFDVEPARRPSWRTPIAEWLHRLADRIDR